MDKGIFLVITTSVLGMINAHQNNAHAPPLNAITSYTDEELYADTLKLHNGYRSRHGSGPLTLNKELCANAKNWATKLINENKFEHQTNSPYGENLYALWSSQPVEVTAKDAFFGWYNEGQYYDYWREPRNNKAGHFTQIVWKDTKYLGVAMAKNAGKTVIVATYFPPGNYVGQYKKNVLRPKY